MSSVSPLPPSDIEQITPAEAQRRVRSGALLIDVREDNERAGGMPQGATDVARAQLPQRIGGLAPAREHEILTICATG